MRDITLPHARPPLVRYWLWTFLTGAFLVGWAALFVQGVRQGWMLAALILIGAAILLFAASTAVHVRVLSRLHRQRTSLVDGAQRP